MPCGFTTDFLYQKLKAAEEQGSETAAELLRDFLFSPGDDGKACSGDSEGEATRQDRAGQLPSKTTY